VKRDIDSYRLNRFEGTELEQIERHLLMCETCRNAVDDTGTYTMILREHLVTVACERTRVH